ncbi:hypothetical protein Bca101_083483 [Brassica carinata]
MQPDSPVAPSVSHRNVPIEKPVLRFVVAFGFIELTSPEETSDGWDRHFAVRFH